MSKKILVIVDMQNDFLLPEGALYLGHDTSKLRGRVASFAKTFDGKVIATMDLHETDDVEFEQFPKHCINGSHGQELCDEIDEIKYLHRISKKSFSSHYVAEAIMKHNPETIFVAGVCTHICVNAIVQDLVNFSKTHNNSHPTIIINKPFVDDFDSEMAYSSLVQMESVYGALVM